jgi:hypothetical protein
MAAEDRDLAPSQVAGHVAAILRQAATSTPALVAASALAVALPLAATGLLVIPGLWLFTRWSLFAPAIVHERLGPLASLARSAALVRGAAGRSPPPQRRRRWSSTPSFTPPRTRRSRCSARRCWRSPSRR